MLTRSLMLPSALVGGIFGLTFIQLCGMNDNVSDVITHDWIWGWSELPGFLINIIFATLFMGSKIPSLKEAWRWAGPQLAYGQVLAWGNWAVACLITQIMLIPAFGVNPLFSSMLPVGFEGGHGTAAGLKESYILLGFPEGGDIAVTSATIGILLGVILGTVVCNIANHYGWTYAAWKKSIDNADVESNSVESPTEEKNYSSEIAIGSKVGILRPNSSDQILETKIVRKADIFSPETRKVGSFLTISNDSMDTLALHIAYIGLALLLAYGTKRILMLLEGTSAWLTEYGFFTGFPLFPLCMLWGLFIQVFCDRFYKFNPIERGTMERIGGAALDFLVLTAIATTKIDAVADSIVPLLILVVMGVAWQLSCFFLLGPLMLPDAWAERAICELGKGFGTSAVGLMLLRIVDPNLETPAIKAFSCKQLLHEPFMGGGIWTSLALPLIVSVGNWAVFGVSMGFISFWLLMWWFVFRLEKVGPMVQYKFNPEYNEFTA